MCSISGIVFDRFNNNATEMARGLRTFEKVVCSAEDRGRDSFGLVAVLNNKTFISRKYIGKPSEHRMAFTFQFPGGLGFILNNNRAEPTTEYVAQKSYQDIQPFLSGNWIVAHNGTIANDKELVASYSLNPITNIDTAVIPCLLSKVFGQDQFEPEHVAEFLSEKLVGSYALAIGHAQFPNKVLLMTNYKPLYISYDRVCRHYIFTSQKQYLESDLLWNLHNNTKVMQVEPYSAVVLSQYEKPKQWSIRAESSCKKKALVVCSGGLDSTVVAAKAVKEGYDVTLLHFRYSCRAETREVKAVYDIAKRLGCELEFVDTDIFKEVIRSSRLTGTKGNVAEGAAGAEFAHEWVPARNLIMLAIATGIAEARGIETIMLGNNLEESGAYPDNEMEFINKLNEVLPYATQVNKKVTIQMPVGNLMKHEIVKLGLEIEAPLDLCWSCYEAGEVHCGNCGPCMMRKTAFEINGAKEVIEYAHSKTLTGKDIEDV